MALCLSHGGTTVYSSDSPSDQILIATVRGVFTAERRDAKNWRVSRKSLEACHVSSLVIDPTSGTLFAGCHKGSLYASRDLGKTWERRDNGLTQKDVWSLNFARTNGSSKLYAGTEPAHLFVSEDLGETWDEIASLRSVPSVPYWNFPPPPHTAHVKNITFDPHNPRAIYIGVEQGALLKSEDGGLTWARDPRIV